MAFIGPLPTTGPWTAFGLGRTQFLLIFALSVALFVFLDGPVWRHVHDRHLARLAWSYAAIPAVVAVAQAANRTFTWGRLLGATVTVGVLKLVVTAVLLAMLGMVGQ